MKYASFTDDGKNVLYSESFWTGKKDIVIDGEPLVKLSKKNFVYNENTYTIKGNILFGSKLIGPDTIVLVRDLKWWEYILVCLPLIMVFIGGAIGGVLGVLFAVENAVCMRKFKNIILKIVFSLVAAGCAFLLWFVISTFILGLLS